MDAYWDTWFKKQQKKEEDNRKYFKLMLEAHPSLKKMAEAAWMSPQENVSDPLFISKEHRIK